MTALEKRAVYAFNNFALCFGIKVDQDVTAENHIKWTQSAHRRTEIELLEMSTSLQVRFQVPGRALPVKVLHQQ